MSYLETKRNALMNAIQSGGFNNLLENVSWANGYFDRSGNVASPSSTQLEVYCEDYIEVEPDSYYIWQMEYGRSVSTWATYTCYDSDKNYISRPDLPTTSNEYKVLTFKTPSNAYYIRPTFRTYGSVNVALIKDENVTIEVTAPQ